MHKLLNCMQCNLFNIISKKLLISYYLFYEKGCCHGITFHDKCEKGSGEEGVKKNRKRSIVDPKKKEYRINEKCNE